ncbi:MAG TPA: hypothetical protein VKU94_02725 [Geobacterales bacterium]|nr:hypothetical protein [Geobacterales bacterium]
MGGKGKKGIAQLAKRQEKALKESAQKQKKEQQRIAEKKERQSQAVINEQILESVKSEVKETPYLSPWVIASKYGIKMGEAKRILQSLEKEGVIKYAYKSSRNPIFVAA